MMTNREIAKRLRGLIDATSNGIALSVSIQRIADELDPTRPEPGTVVWFPIDEECGVVADNGRGVYTSCGELVPWGSLQEGTKPARIAGPMQEIVDIPPVSEWPVGALGLDAVWYFPTQDHIVTQWRITNRTEAARREAEG